MAMFSNKLIPGVAFTAAGLFAIAGCGTAVNPTAGSSSGAIQPQSQPPTGPTLGYVWDSAGKGLRPLHGIPGASIVGTAIVSAPGQGAAFVAAASSSASGMAVFLDANGAVFQTPLSGGKLTQIGSVAGVKTLVLSNSGKFVLLTGKDGAGVNIASVISGLPQSPSTRALNLSGFGTILSGSVGDTGIVALAGSSGQGGVSILAYAGQGTGTPVASIAAFGGMQFVPGSDELIVADAGSGALTVVSHVGTTPVSATLSPAGSIAAPVAIDVTPNARWVVAANHTGDVLRIDLTGAVPATKLHCVCAPTQVQALNGSATGTTVRLVSDGAGPLWIVDAGNATPRVQFIPAIPTGVATTLTKSAM